MEIYQTAAVIRTKRLPEVYIEVKELNMIMKLFVEKKVKLRQEIKFKRGEKIG